MNIRIENLTMQFKGTKALDNLNLEIGEGIFGLLGENGAGKTTLMRILTTLLEPTSGSVYLFDEEVNSKNRESIKQIVGYLPQELGLYPSLTVRESLEYIGGLCGISKNLRNERIDSLLELTNLKDHQRKKNRQLSGGMKRRVGLVQAMLHEPKILIVDEPTTGLDPEERIRIRNLLSDFSQGRTILFSTHVVEDITATCFQLCVLSKGKIKYKGSLESMKQNAEGHVYQCKVNSEKELKAIRDKYFITGNIHEEGKICVRFLSEKVPENLSCDRVNTTLEDAYIYLNISGK
jgi:ABC-type multidrug transport system ATPase subunit